MRFLSWPWNTGPALYLLQGAQGFKGVCPTSPHVFCELGEGIRPCPLWHSARGALGVRGRRPSALCHQFCSLFLWTGFLGAVRGRRGSGSVATGFHLLACPTGKRPRGRPRTHWSDCCCVPIQGLHTSRTRPLRSHQRSVLPCALQAASTFVKWDSLPFAAFPGCVTGCSRLYSYITISAAQVCESDKTSKV